MATLTVLVLDSGFSHNMFTTKDLCRLRLDNVVTLAWYGICTVKWLAMTSIANSAIERPTDVGFFYGSVASIQAVNALVSEISRTTIPVLLVGESGTGKDAYARLIHELSGSKVSLKKISCAAPDARRFFEDM